MWYRRCRASLTAWSIEALAPYRQHPAKHHRLLIHELEAVARGENDRLMVFMPPRHGKSVFVSRLFPPWFLSLNPQSSIIAASHTYELAEDFGRSVRNTVAQYRDVLGYSLRPDSTAAGRWSTGLGGSYLAAGVGKAIAGRPANCIVIDDPVANRQDAESETVRERTWAWYRSDLYTRLQPGGRIILLMTRWHEDDLAGRLLNEMEQGGDQWRIIRLPALATDPDDAMGREIGEPLWPEWFDAAALARIRQTVGERDWTALYQQNPRPPEGTLFRVGMIDTHEAAPICTSVVRAWDLAATEKKASDWTVGLKMGRTQIGGYVILDVIRFKGGPDEVTATIANTARADGRSVHVRIPDEPGEAGKHLTLHLTRQLAGFMVQADRESGDKATRAMPIAAQVNVGNVSMVRAPWNTALRDELAAFPVGTWDDQVDALSGAFSVVGLGRPGLHINPDAGRRMAGLGGLQMRR